MVKKVSLLKESPNTHFNASLFIREVQRQLVRDVGFDRAAKIIIDYANNQPEHRFRDNAPGGAVML